MHNTTGLAVGVASLMRINPAAGVIETGHINYSPALQQKPAATEAMYLLMRRVFDELGYRRYEWKCDALNAPSRAAAQRLGFQFEGIFRQNTVYKNRNRDTAWFSIIDSEWPALKAAFESWLDPENFDQNGHQRKSLVAFRQAGWFDWRGPGLCRGWYQPNEECRNSATALSVGMATSTVPCKFGYLI